MPPQPPPSHSSADSRAGAAGGATVPQWMEQKSCRLYSGVAPGKCEPTQGTLLDTLPGAESGAA